MEEEEEEDVKQGGVSDSLLPLAPVYELCEGFLLLFFFFFLL